MDVHQHPDRETFIQRVRFSNVPAERLEFEVTRLKGGDRKLLFINGYGGNLEQPGVRWLTNRFTEHGLDVTHVQLPTEVRDFESDVLAPTREVEREMGVHVAAGFSFGGLTLTFLKKPRKRIFLSPFWGVNERWMVRGTEGVVSLLSIITKPMLPRRFGKKEAGPLAVDEDLKGIPDRVSFTTIDQFFKAQKKLPPPRDGDVVFYSPQDKVVSLNAIDGRGVETHTFKGGHMFYLSRDRKQLMESIMEQVDLGFDE